MILEDGTGKGYKAKISKENKLEVDAVSTRRLSNVSEYEGKAFIMASEGFISLTTIDQEHAVFYLKYNGSETLHIDNIRTCGDGNQKWKMYVNSTAGTLISSGTSVNANNLNLTSENSLTADIKVGSNGSTVTDGTIFENWINHNGHSVENLQGALILGKGDSIVLTCEVPVASDVCIRLHAYEHND